MAEIGIDLRLESSALHGSFAKVWLNGEDISAKVLGVKLTIDADQPTVAEIRYLVRSLNVDNGAKA